MKGLGIQVLTVIAVGMALCHQLWALSAGELDPSFNGTGRVPLRYGYGDDMVTAMALQEDGKIIVAGSTGSSRNDVFGNDMAVVRLNADGSLDPSFGQKGKVITRLPNQGSALNSVRIQTDGKIVAGGIAYQDHELNKTVFVLVRYLQDGTLDPTFGSGGVVLTDIYDRDYIRTVHILPNNKILVAGHAQKGGTSNLVLARYRPDGSLDSDFSTNGFAVHSYQGEVQDMLVLSDEKILICTDADRMRILRCLPNGQVDTAFGQNGWTTTPHIGAKGYSLAIQPARLGVFPNDPKILVAGGLSGSGGEKGFIVARFTMEGQLDTSFGGGVVITQMGSVYHAAQAVVVEPSPRGLPARIIVAGYSQSSISGHTRYDFTVVKYLNNGTLDSSFGNGGVVVTPIGVEGKHPSQAIAAIRQGDHFLVGGVVSHYEVSGDMAVAKYDSVSGALDSSFGKGGIQVVDVGEKAWVEAVGIAVASNGGVVAASNLEFETSSTPRCISGINSFLSDGTPDPEFGQEGRVVIDIAEETRVQALGIHAASGNIAIAGVLNGKRTMPPIGEGFTQPRLFVASLLADGRKNGVFGDGGVVISDVTVTQDSNSLVAVQPDGKILVSCQVPSVNGPQHLILRYATNGQLDSSFGGTGKALISLIGNDEQIFDMHLQSNGAILLALGQPNAGGKLEMMRLLPNGSMDASFGLLGKVSTQLDWAALALGVTARSDGKIMLTGAAIVELESLGVDVLLARYTVNGELDSAFDVNGIAIAPTGTGAGFGIKAFPRDGGKTLVVGIARLGNDLQNMLLQFLPNGSLDPAFGGNGRALISFLPVASQKQIAMDVNGCVLIASGSEVARILTENMAVESDSMGIYSITRMSNGVIRLQGWGQAGRSYTVRGSLTLQNGYTLPLGTITPNTEGQWSYEDNDAQYYPARYYWLTEP